MPPEFSDKPLIQKFWRDNSMKPWMKLNLNSLRITKTRELWGDVNKIKSNKLKGGEAIDRKGRSKTQKDDPHRKNKIDMILTRIQPMEASKFSMTMIVTVLSIHSESWRPWIESSAQQAKTGNCNWNLQYPSLKAAEDEKQSIFLMQKLKNQGVCALITLSCKNRSSHSHWQIHHLIPLLHYSSIPTNN